MNRVGKDGSGINYYGDSVAINPKGQELVRLEPEKAGLVTVRLSMKELIKFREKFPAWKDSDGFTLDN